MTNLQQKIITSIKEGKNANIISLPGSGVSRFLQDLSAKPQKIQAFSDKQILFYYDCSYGEELFIPVLEGFLSTYSKEDSVFKQIYDLLNRNYSLTFLFDEYSFKYQHLSRYANLLGGLDKSKTSSLLVIFPHEYYSADLMKLNPTLSHNLIFYTYFNYTESIQFAQEYISKYNLKIKHKHLDQIINFSGGIYLILKNLLRSYTDYPNWNNLSQSEEVVNAINIVWTSFTEREQKFLRLIANHEFKKEYTNELNYFQKLGLVNEHLHLQGEWISHILTPQKTRSLQVKSSSVYLNGRNISKYFKIDEAEVLKKLVLNKGRVISRDEVFATRKRFFGPDTFSIAAIDQFISRLRRKLSTLGLAQIHIDTVRGKGYRIK